MIIVLLFYKLIVFIIYLIRKVILNIKIFDFFFIEDSIKLEIIVIN